MLHVTVLIPTLMQAVVMARWRVIYRHRAAATHGQHKHDKTGDK
ncbi:hypothetical protein [Spirosoma utsteinense]|uniref:Uncharacterized protein n=1 Tax=Spirosoma utsteinense TaxID=2585773 RepID=A0ABR6W6I0_9BACT|nr:hypothetical protein [Spirosoma utsteinense]MBC3791758.1 hypothetical protein [Spirosoma utsteinense]